MGPVAKLMFSAPTYGLGPPNFNWVEEQPSKWVTVTGNFENSGSNNHWPQSHQSGERYDRGSNWTAFKSSFSKSTFEIENHQQRFGGAWFGYKGPIIVHDDSHFTDQDFLDLDLGATSEVDLIGLGSTAISRVLPTNPISDVPTALGELVREGIPGVIPGGITRPDSIGRPAGGYLGYQFGIKPFLRELQAFGDAVRNAEQHISEFAKRAGKLIRRRYDFFPVEETYDVVYDTFSGTRCFLGGPAQSQVKDFLTVPYGGFPGVRTDTITRRKKSWFSGAFTYYLPEVGTGLSSAIDREYQEARKLFGGLSVSTAWNLLPYSWAADWMFNAGNVLRNIEAFSQDGLVMPWGYVMEQCDFHVHRKVEGARFSEVYLSDPYTTLPDVIDSIFEVKFMRRRKATPFGFGLDVDGFTNRQKAILGALAIEKIF